MNPFGMLHNETVYIIKADESRQGPFKTKVGKTATIFEKELDIDVGDVLERPIPGNKIERYKITDVTYSSGLVTIPPHYSLKLQKIAA
ncbi:hypothetical protein V8U11_10855 [Pseudomonas chlororaphis]|uniref:hypothetical protein n=1 Tax=Pseudomonas chlororaphis TaxID=587753 RepID=UPI000F585BFA|nr:hypothetical protein [Pseudomonas chlororaphis]